MLGFDLIVSKAVTVKQFLLIIRIMVITSTALTLE